MKNGAWATMLVAIAALAIARCGGGGADAPAAAPDEAADHALLDAAKEPLDRAREVEDISAGRKAQLDEEIEDADR